MNNSTHGNPAPEGRLASEMAWAAGFIDGEGCFGIAREWGRKPDAPMRRPSLQVSNTHLHSLRHLQRILWGYGQIVPLKRRKPHHKPQYKLGIRNKLHLISICHAMLPYLCTKHGGAELVLAFCISRKLNKGMGKNAPFSANELRMAGLIEEINYRQPERTAV